MLKLFDNYSTIELNCFCAGYINWPYLYRDNDHNSYSELKFLSPREKMLHQKSIIVNKISNIFNKTNILLLFILAAMNTQVFAQNCDPDTEPPSVICLNGLVVNFNNGEPILTVWATDLDAGTLDNCTEAGELDFRIQLASQFDNNVPVSESLNFITGPLVEEVVLWVGDGSGNWDYCNTTVEVSCQSDMVAPIAICDEQLTINATGNQAEINVNDLDEGSYDNCSEVSLALALFDDYDSENPPAATTLLLNDFQSEYTVVLSVQDDSGNENACWATVQVNWGDCEDDQTAPTPYCLVGLEVNGQFDEFDIDVWALDFDVASFDNCTPSENLLFRLEREGDFSGTPPETAFITVTEADPAIQVVHMWVGDESGNWDYCTTTLAIVSCDNDVIAPVAVCDEQLSFNVVDESEFPLLAIDVDDGSYDNCGEVTLSIGFLDGFDQYNPPVTEDIILTNASAEHPVVLVVTDESGNQSFCFTTVTVDWNCTEDTVAPQLGCPGSISYLNQNNLPNPKLWAVDVAHDDVVDNCTPSDNLVYAIEFSADFVEDDPPSADYLSLDGLATGVYPVMVWVGDESGNWAYCESILFYSTTPTMINVSGYVFADTLSNCTMDSEEAGIAGRTIFLRNIQTGNIQFVESDANGYYEVSETYLLLQPTQYELGIVNTPNTNMDCEMTVVLDVPPGTTANHENDFGFGFEQQDPYCASLSVDLGTEALRHCFENQYQVFYCNNSLGTVGDAYIEIELDEFLEYTGSSLPYANAEGNVYRFDIGTLGPLECGSFSLDIFVACEAEMGLTHCTEAHIFPDDPCDEPDEAWSGAIVEVSGFCDDEGVHMIIENVGNGNMPEPRNYIVVEDVVMFSSSPFQLDAGMDMQIDFPANGSTWRLEAEQEPGYQGYSQNAVAVEGCGGIDMTGLVNIFGFNDEPNFASVDCQPNVSSFDPNDKQAFPTGYSNANYIEANTEIEYMIRFQNTGTAPAFKVVLLDTLSGYLDPATLQTGAASHPYRAELVGGNILKFTFDGIVLPDSTTNEPASHGFVKFKIDQLPDIPNGTVILNRAGIYFDANPVVVTNEVMHTIGEHFITVSVGAVLLPETEVKVFPNPYNESTRFTIEGQIVEQGFLSLYNSSGQLVFEKEFEGKQFELQGNDLKTGLYFFRLQVNGQMIVSGKIIKE